MSRSLNKVQLIGNLTQDPVLKVTPQGTSVATFSIATNRSWTDSNGQKNEEADYHRIVVWAKLADICDKYLSKGSKVYVDGRLSTRNWETDSGEKRSTTEVVVSEMIMLGGNQKQNSKGSGNQQEPEQPETVEDMDIDDIPF